MNTVLGFRWLLSLLRTEQPCDAQPAVLAQVTELLAKGANKEAVEKDGKNALHAAAKAGHAAVVRELPGQGRGGPLESKSEFGPSTITRPCVACGYGGGPAVAAH